MANLPNDTATEPLRLNLGSGQNPKPGFVNVDKFGSPDIKCDLEKFPWPWADSSVDEIVLVHVLEHLGESVETFFGIMKELYRICKHNAHVNIVVPHPRHTDFLGDPTHVRAFLPDTFFLFSKQVNRKCLEIKASNSPLGMYLDIDFEVAWMQKDLDTPWSEQLEKGKITQDELEEAERKFNNVVRQIRLGMLAVKPGAPVAAPATRRPS